MKKNKKCKKIITWFNRSKILNHSNIKNKREKWRVSYFGHCLTPSSVSLDSGGFLSILTPNFSIVVVDMASALTTTTLLLVEKWWEVLLLGLKVGCFNNKKLLLLTHAIASIFFFFWVFGKAQKQNPFTLLYYYFSVNVSHSCLITFFSHHIMGLRVKLSAQ